MLISLNCADFSYAIDDEKWTMEFPQTNLSGHDSAIMKEFIQSL